MIHDWWNYPAAGAAARVLIRDMTPGRRYYRWELVTLLEVEGIDESNLGAALKFARHELRIDIPCDRHRENSVYWTEPTDAEAVDDARKRQERWYSEATTSYRTKVAYLTKVQEFGLRTFCMALGQELGLTPTEIMADLGI